MGNTGKEKKILRSILKYEYKGDIMRGKKAKQIRKQVYNDMATNTSEYSIIKHIKKVFIKDENGVPTKVDKVTGQRLCSGLRAKYLKAKKVFSKK